MSIGVESHYAAAVCGHLIAWHVWLVIVFQCIKFYIHVNDNQLGIHDGDIFVLHFRYALKFILLESAERNLFLWFTFLWLFGNLYNSLTPRDIFICRNHTCIATNFAPRVLMGYDSALLGSDYLQNICNRSSHTVFQETCVDLVHGIQIQLNFIQENVCKSF